jgi:hypothetical protein
LRLLPVDLGQQHFLPAIGAIIHRHPGLNQKNGQSGSAPPRTSRPSIAGAQSKSVAELQTEKDSMAGRGEFELPVPISEQSDYNKISGSRRPDEVSGSPRRKRQFGLYGRQYSRPSLRAR